MSIEERTAFLEAELNKLEKELARKHREIEVEKALEKVRVKALDMRSSAELSETSTILFEQLKELKIDALRTGVGIFDEENNAIELWVTSLSADGRPFFLLQYININVHPVFENMLESKHAGKMFAVTKLEGKALMYYHKTMSTYSGLPGRKESTLQEYFYSFYFSAGAINVVTNNELTSEEAHIMLRLTNVFGLIYTRFLDLKRSEDQAILINEEKKMLESTLENLKAAQSQLIQAEKMASLGELTAGIAHEIQNPLNFVNNFSEVNKELIGEMKSEIENGNYEEVKMIADDIEKNQDKINQHGKRADAIVKGMLQHSRSSSGQKEPTDINVLCDEYLRLAYHGLRAKDKNFNVRTETNFDPSLGKINVVPQELGRVILNLINNAYYAVNEKKKSSFAEGSEGQQYLPTVTISTSKNNGMIEIKVEDNGLGISQKVLDKVFQPFFTTKPAGQGTGLGLSLAYDIIKVHGGELKVETKEGEGSEFIIVLPIN